MLYMLAEKMGRRIPEMMEMTANEYFGWVAYYTVMQKKRKAGK